MVEGTWKFVPESSAVEKQDVEKERITHMKSYLIKDTTKQERIELIRQWVPADEAMEDCEIDLWDMYHDYIEGKREIAEINLSFVEGE